MARQRIRRVEPRTKTNKAKTAKKTPRKVKKAVKKSQLGTARRKRTTLGKGKSVSKATPKTTRRVIDRLAQLELKLKKDSEELTSLLKDYYHIDCSNTTETLQNGQQRTRPVSTPMKTARALKAAQRLLYEFSIGDRKITSEDKPSKYVRR